MNDENGEMDALRQQIANLTEIVTKSMQGPVARVVEGSEEVEQTFEAVGAPPADVGGTMYEEWWKHGFAGLQVDLLEGERWALKATITRADTAQVSIDFTAGTHLGKILPRLFDALKRQPVKQPMRKYDPNSEPANMAKVIMREEDRYLGRR